MMQLYFNGTFLQRTRQSARAALTLRLLLP
jgi:hypothetical protein